MSSIGQSFSQLSKGFTSLNSKLALRIPYGPSSTEEIGPIGPTTGRNRLRRGLDKAFGVLPSEGDPGYVPPANPQITPVTPMPIPGQDDLASMAARRQSIQQQLFRRGRFSTILSDPQSEPLGG